MRAKLSHELIGQVCERVRPHRPDGHGEAWATLEANHDQLKAWLVKEKLTVVKVHDLLTRQGTVVAQRTLHRYALEVLGVERSARATTVRVADGEPGSECQVDFGKMGLVPDPATGRRRVAWALVFTACYSRHCFVWLTHRQTTEAVIAGFEAAWAFFDGVFRVVIPDNMAAIVDRADPLSPRFNQAVVEYAQTRGFVIDPARVRLPQDKPRVERPMPYVRDSFWRGRHWADLAQRQAEALRWCVDVAGARSHRSLDGAAPLAVFKAIEAPALLPLPPGAFELASWWRPKVGPDCHVRVGKALYSVPWRLIGRHVDAREGERVVEIFVDGTVVKTWARVERGRQTDWADYPPEKVAFFMRTPAWCRRRAAELGPSVAAVVEALFEHNAMHRLRSAQGVVRLAERYPPERLEAACARALEVGDASYRTIKGILAAGTEAEGAEPARVPAAPAHLHGPAGLFGEGEAS